MKPLVIVTGACGYIGSHTVIELLRTQRFQVVSIDNFMNSDASALDHIQAITGVKVPHHTLDLCNLEATQATFKHYQGQVAGVIHFAALKSVPDSVADPILYYHNNLNSLINVIKVCEEQGIKNLIFSSSCSVYGNTTELPVKETTPLETAESPYAYTKQIGEQILKDNAKTSKINTIALRYFNPVGADHTGLNGENPINPPTALVPIITQVAAGLRPKITVYGTDYNTRDGSCIRDYIHVSDIADAHIKALDFLLNNKNTSNYQLFNLGTGNGVSVLEAIKTFETECGLKLNYELGPRRSGDVEAIYSDSSAAANLLGWVPQRTLADMLKSAWAWQQQIVKNKTT